MAWAARRRRKRSEVKAESAEDLHEGAPSSQLTTVAPDKPRRQSSSRDRHHAFVRTRLAADPAASDLRFPALACAPVCGAGACAGFARFVTTLSPLPASPTSPPCSPSPLSSPSRGSAPTSAPTSAVASSPVSLPPFPLPPRLRPTNATWHVTFRPFSRPRGRVDSVIWRYGRCVIFGLLSASLP